MKRFTQSYDNDIYLFNTKEEAKKWVEPIELNENQLSKLFEEGLEIETSPDIYLFYQYVKKPKTKNKTPQNNPRMIRCSFNN